MQRTVEFKNFKPTSSTHRFCSQKFDRIWGRLPENSSFIAKVVRASDRTYRTILELTKSGEEYTGEAHNGAVRVSIALAAERLERALKKEKELLVS